MTAPATSGRWISTFLEAISAEAGAAGNTKLAYGRDLRDFAEWAARGNFDFATLSRAEVEAYLIHCDAQGLSKATRARRLSSIRQLYRFAFEENWRGDNPALRISGPGRSKSLPKTLSEDEVALLLDTAAAHGRSPAEKARNAALLELLYATGLRVTELVSLPLAVMRGTPAMILVKGKGGRERLVPLSPPSQEAVAQWLIHAEAAADQARAAGKPVSKFLFPGTAPGKHLTRQALFTLIQSIALKAGLAPDRVTPHILRHAFATHLLAGGADLRVIQMLLGHAELGTTEIYTHVLDQHLKDLVLMHHPLARRGRPEA